jgi:clan AA aspartic protease (TIGR02281 family)
VMAVAAMLFVRPELRMQASRPEDALGAATPVSSPGAPPTPPEVRALPPPTAAPAAATVASEPPGTPQPPSTAELLGLARKLVAQGALKDAEGLYRKLAQTAPGSVQVHFELGLLCSDLHEVDCAVAELSRALELRPGDPEILEPLASILREAGKIEPAVDAYRQLVRQNRLDPRPLLELGRTLDAASRVDDAVVAFQEFLSRFPDAPEAAEVRRRFEELTRDDEKTPEDRSAEVPITRSGSAILVSGQVEDAKDVRFLVDTGSTLTIISTELAEELGFDVRRGDFPTMELQTANGPVEAPVVTLDTIQLGRAVGHNVRAAVYDIRAVDPIDGLLGLSFLEQFRFTIDGAGKKMHLQPR